ncbi:MAG: GNAT family N-acetyltransferase [Candidatus Dormibacteria bacterium]
MSSRPASFSVPDEPRRRLAPERVGIRLLERADAERLLDLRRRSRTYLEPWEPARPESFFTLAGQRQVVDELLARRSAGQVEPLVVSVDAAVAGCLTLSNIVQGSFRSCSLGYWVAEEYSGRGVAGEGVRLTLTRAFGELGLHRVEAATLLDNLASQAVLQRNGFERIGLAPAYLSIAGRWQDHLLFQRTAAEAAGAR